MTRQARSLYAVGLSIAALGAAAAPSAAPPQLPVAPSTVQLTSTPDGNLHVTLNLNVKLTGISPFATAALLCNGAVEPHNTVAAVVSAASGGSLTDQMYQTWFTGSNLAGQAWNQTFPLTLSHGSYQGTQAVSFVVPASRFLDQTHQHTISSPALFVGCSLQLSDGTHTKLATLAPGTAGQQASDANFSYIASGSNVVAVMQDVTFKPW